MTATLTQSPNRVLLKNISWQTYQSLVKDFEQQPAIRLTYDQGLLEIRMPLEPHETYKKLLGRLVEALTEELKVEIRSLGSRTCDREDLARGLEPDQCYYIQNEQAVWNKEQIDLKQDPPPDLAIEIDEVRGSPVVARRGLSDITSSSINRLDIYGDLGVPEIWRYDGQSLTMYYLENKQYQPGSRSIAFPLLTPDDIDRFLVLKKTTKENALIRQFRSWVREHLAIKG